MSLPNEIILTATAIGFGFTLATGINITFFDRISNTANNVSIEERTSKIPEFWDNYNNSRSTPLTKLKTQSGDMYCITIDSNEICAPNNK